MWLLFSFVLAELAAVYAFVQLYSAEVDLKLSFVMAGAILVGGTHILHLLPRELPGYEKRQQQRRIDITMACLREVEPTLGKLTEMTAAYLKAHSLAAQRAIRSAEANLERELEPYAYAGLFPLIQAMVHHITTQEMYSSQRLQQERSKQEIQAS